MEESRGLPPYLCRRLRRTIALALPLGLLATLIAVISASAYVSKKTESTLADFDSGTFLYTGLLDIPPDTHSVQLLPIGLTGDWSTSTRHLPQPLANLAATTSGDYVYVVGGTNSRGLPVKAVYASQMSTGGELTPWSTEVSLPQARGGVGIAAWPINASSAMLYAVGGFGSDLASQATIYRALLDNDTGVVGPWVADSQALPQPLHYASVVVHDGYLYVVGGSKDLVSQNTVYYAPINLDGSLGSFSTAEPLPQPTANGYAVVYEGVDLDTLYVIGGWIDVTSTFKVHFADFLPNGELTPWTLSKGNLPLHLFGHSGVLVNGVEILVTGGIADSTNPQTGISNTVKAALVDPDNASFRLYDWCGGDPFPICTIGAWQTGGLLPEVRALHASVAGRGNIYVIGGQDAVQDPRDTVFFGTVTGVGGLYSPEGTYLSDPIPLGHYDASLKRLRWQTTIAHPDDMSLTMEYRTSNDGMTWSAWSDQVASVNGVNEINPSPPPTGIRFVQYRAEFTTAASVASPLLDEVEIYYEVADPDVRVKKDSGSVISVPVGANLVYTIYYTNTGHYPAPNVVLTETLPENTTYAGTGWQHVDGRVYTRTVGDLGPEAHGLVPFGVKVAGAVPDTVRHITNTVEIGFPPLIDAFGETIVDPVPENNFFQFSNALSLFAITLTKQADPPTSVTVQPGSIINYTIYYTNTGLRAASQAVLTDVFDLEGDYVVLSANPPPDREGHIWDLGRVPPGESGQIDISVQLAPSLPNGWSVTNQAAIHSPEGTVKETPVLTHVVINPPGTQLVDLTATRIRLEPPNPQPGAPMVITADIANIGTKDASAFWVELYIRPSPSEQPSGPADHEGGYFPIGGGPGRLEYTWNPSGLAWGMAASLPFPRPGLAWSDDPFPSACTRYDIYVQVDVAGNVPPDNAYWGIYPEAEERNNIAHLEYMTPCEDGAVYLPLVSKR